MAFDMDIEAQWEASRAYGAPIISALLAQGWPKDVVININFPNCDDDAVTGVEVTRQGFRNMHEMHAVKREDPRGRTYYWMDFHSLEQTLVDGTDLKAVAENRISVTPLHLDLTHSETFAKLKGVLGGAAPKKVREAAQ